MTDDEKDVEQEIKEVDADDQAVNQLLKEILFDEIIRDNKIKFDENKQDYKFTSKIDGAALGREEELGIEIITPNYHYYDEINETVTLNGQTAVNTTKEYLRINRMVVRSAGTGGSNAGVIYAGTGTVTTGVPANVYASVNGVTGANQSLMALWTVPAGYTAYILQYDVSNGTTSNTPAVCKLILAVRPYGEVFQTKDVKSLTTGMHVEETFSIPLKVEEKSDIEIRALSSSASVSFDISAALEIIYIQNDGA